MSTRTIKLTHRVLRIAFEGVSMLSARTLKTISYELRVGRLVSTLRPDYQATETARDLILAKHPVPEGWDQPVPSPAVQEARTLAFNAFLEEETKIDVPEHLLITTEMLPIEVKGKPENRECVAQIVALLGPLFVGADPDDAAASE